ncbi:META domain-containing protein [Winogradskyella aurantia]|uniref:META domain-containing protein n=1 Tax=Winogradskyella aurantia TaxID=1915063 RepID=A0A265UX59_9FLAO|nr:META domain-containing protein [Winogradskyella aurantia]OZV69886.1 hypothetical protein CA834_04505 [Winogradskyella aurantia]
MKLVIGWLLCLVVFSCANNKSSTEVFWVSGIKSSCDNGAGKSECVMICKETKANDDNWENFYSEIEGFEFKKGVLQKIEVLVTQKEDPLPADASSLNYKLVKVLEQKPDNRGHLIGEWYVQSIDNELIPQDSVVPALSIHISDKTIYGNGGCNSYKGSITQLGIETLSFGELLSTLRLCEHQALEDKYLAALRETAAYKIKDDKLHLYSKDRNKELVFKRMDKSKNTTRINDIWAAVRIEGNPINRMVEVPKLEVNVGDMKVFGTDGCNNYFGTILELNEEIITLGGIGSTRKMCPDMDVPQRYNEALSKINSYEFDNQLLIFTDKDGNEVLAFLKTD